MPYPDSKSGSLNAIAAIAGTLLAIVIGVIAWSVWAIVAVSSVLLAAVETAVASSLAGLISTLYLMMILEILAAGLFLISGGPVSALAWIGSRITGRQLH